MDYAASTPMSKQSLGVYQQVATTLFANAMSLHDEGSAARDLVMHCRQQLAMAVNGEMEGMIFTSGGSESNWIALYGLAMGHRQRGRHILTIKGEHPSITRTLATLKPLGFDIEEVPVNANGIVELETLERYLKKETILVALAHVNGEIGTIQPIDAIGRLLHARGVLFHVDAVQSFGKLAIDVRGCHISSLSVSSHKIFGPKGVGACYIHPLLYVEPLLPNISHENGLRQGTVNVPGIAAFMAASEDALNKREEHWQQVTRIKESMISRLEALHLPLIIEGSIGETSPYFLAFRMKGREGQWVMLEANRHGLALSSGSACSLTDHEPSPTLLALGRTETEAHELVRLSFSWKTTEAEVHKAATILAHITQ
ncbi:IscS subfamily cysteine desulfurase [Pullulanibacillus camelliae]|nr:IscS subfamily cysteine desulfurase [Pullulanibacillus camelliae]